MPLRMRVLWDRVQSSNIGNRIAKGAFWSLIGSAFAQIFMLLASIVIARFLGKISYGELGIIRSTVSMFAVFAGFGIGLTATRYVADYKINNKSKAGKIIGLSTILASITGLIIVVVILVSAPFLASNSLNAPHLTSQLYLSTIILFFSALNGSQTGILAGFEEFKSIAKLNFFSALISLPIQIILTWFGGLNGAIVGLGSNYLLLWFFSFKLVRVVAKKYEISINYKRAWEEWQILYRFSLPALLSGVIVSPIMWACNAMLVNRPNGYEEMAIFDAANQWRTLILFVPATLSRIALPILTSTTDNSLHFNKVLRVNILINFLSSFLFAIFVIIFSKFIMNSYGDGFDEGVIVLVVLAISGVFMSINSVIGHAIASRERMWMGFLFNLFWGVVLLISTMIFLRLSFGALAIAYGLLISYMTHTIVQFIYLKKLMAS